MLTVKTDKSTLLQVEKSGENFVVNGKLVSPDMVKINGNTYHLLLNNQSYTVELLATDETGKQLTLMINGVKQTIEIEDEMDALLKKMGFDKLANTKFNQIKAPMPGLVLRLLVREGDAVKKGDGLLVLEAMKMENIIKAPADMVVKKVMVNERIAVEKNQVLIEVA